MDEQIKPKTIYEHLQEGFENAVRKITTYYQTLEVGEKARFVSYLEGLIEGSPTIIETKERTNSAKEDYRKSLESFGVDIYRFRKIIGLTQQELSEKLNQLPNSSRKYHRNYIAKLESGKIIRTTGRRSVPMIEMKKNLDEIAKQHGKESFDKCLNNPEDVPHNERSCNTFAEFGKYLYKVRNDLGLTQTELTERLNQLSSKSRYYHRTTISKLEAGKIRGINNPKCSTIEEMKKDLDNLSIP